MPRTSTRRIRSILDVLHYPARILITLIYLLPLIWMATNAFKSPLDIFAIPPKFLFAPTMANFRMIIAEWGILHYLHSSLIIGLSATILTVLIGTMGGYGLARFEFKNKDLLAMQLVGLKIVPPIIAVISLYLMSKGLGLYNTHLYLILIYTTFNLPMAVWLMRSFISDVPVAIEESAEVDGCSNYSVLRRITLPLILPALAATFMITFIFCWNEFLFANVLTAYETKTLPVIAAAAVKPREVEWGAASAAGLVMFVPALFVCLFIGRYLVRGLTFGAVKG
jgi:multiple sugar transport system permease protein